MEPNLAYRSVKLDGGWRQSWDAILSGRFSESADDGLLFYDAAGGTGEFYSYEGLGNMALLRTNTDWRTTWSQIVPGSYAYGPFTGLLFYERAAGHGELYSTDGLGNLTLLQAHDGWRTSWDQIVAVPDQSGLTRLLFYDRVAGHGEFYANDGHGGIVFQRTYTGWRTTWRTILPLQIGSGTFLLFYEASSGHAELYAVDATGNIELRGVYSDWRSSWSIILPVDLRSTSYAGLVFYDRGAGESELYTIGASGELAHVKSFFGWRSSWALMTKGSFGGVFDDLLLYDREAGEGELLTLHPWPVGPLEGYVSQESVRPGEPITVHVRSTVGPFRVQILRRGLSDSVVSNVGIFPDQPADLPFDGPENGCTWPAAMVVAVPTGSPSGLYIVRLSLLDGGVTAEIPFVVIAEAPGVRTAVLFAIPSSTYEAYCWWGGRSLYGHGTIGGFDWSDERAFRVSPHRPYLGPDDFVTPKLQYWEIPFIRWLERNGIVVDYCTSNELHSDPELLSHYRLIVTVGHDEYWSWEMRDNVEQFAANGGTVAVLSGNSVWWQIRFDDEQAITCYKDRALDPVNDSGDPAMRSRVTVNWIDPELDRPETLMTGVSFQYCTYPRLIYGDGVSSAPVFEVVTEHPVLEDTNLQLGDTFGTYADNVGHRPPWKDGWLTVIGYECDARPTPGSVPTPVGEADPRNPDWRSNWDSIIPADLSVGNSPDMLFYDRGLGEAELHRVEPSGTLALRRFHQGWRSSWDRIIPGDFGATASAALLFYDRSAGVGEFYAIEAGGDIALLQSYDDWRQSWDQIVPGNFGGSTYSDLLFYDRAAGVGEFYATDGSGHIALLQSHEGWRQSWDIIVPGDFGGDSFTDLLFYDRNAGQGEFYAVSGGEIVFLNTESGWRSSWDLILPLRIGRDRTALLFYDRAAGTGEIYATDGSGSISLLRTYLDWRTTWKAIVPLRLDSSNRTFLLFYEAITGYAELYSVDESGTVAFVHSFTDRAFTLIARALWSQTDGDGNVVTREYASMGMLRIGDGRVFSASTTDWSFGLSQSLDRWSVIDQITANLLHLYGSGPRLARPLATVRPAVDPEAVSSELRRRWDALQLRPTGVERLEVREP